MTFPTDQDWRGAKLDYDSSADVMYVNFHTGSAAEYVQLGSWQILRVDATGRVLSWTIPLFQRFLQRVAMADTFFQPKQT